MIQLHVCPEGIYGDFRYTDAAKTCRRHMSKLVKQRCAEGYQGKYTFVIYNKKSIKKNTGEGDSDFHFIFVFFIFQAIVTCIFM